MPNHIREIYNTLDKKYGPGNIHNFSNLELLRAGVEFLTLTKFGIQEAFINASQISNELSKRGNKAREYDQELMEIIIEYK